MNLFSTAALITALVAGSAQAATIYSETFTDQEGQGAIGASVDTSGVDWSIDLGDANLLNNSDQFAVVSDGAFTVRDTNAGCSNSACSGSNPDFADVDAPMWLSPLIDISNFENLVASIFVTGSGGFELSGGTGSQDTFIFELLVDGVSKSVDILNSLLPGEVDGGFEFGISIFADVDGSVGQLKVTANTYANSEILTFDDVTLTGDPLAAVPLPATGLMLIAGLGVLGLRRRKG